MSVKLSFNTEGRDEEERRNGVRKEGKGKGT
jgi:hypothetical protein